MQGRRNILSQRQLAFVAAHVGNDTEAARAAGYKNPDRSAPKLMAMPAVRKAIEEKQKAIIEASGAKIGRRLTKVDVVDRLVELADLPPERTKNNITGQVNALKVIAEIEGYFVYRYEDLTKENFGKVLDGFASGNLPKPGPQNDRQFSAPIGGLTTLKETT